MNLLPVLTLALAPAQPVPLNDLQMRDIGCVAAIGIIAHEQRSGQDALQNYADVREDGKRWAGIVGQRVMDESGQPREVVALAIKQAVEAEQEQAMKIPDAAAHVRKRFDSCKALMDIQLGAWDGVNSTDAAVRIEDTPSMLATDPDWGTDEPDKIAIYRTQLDEDLNNPHRIRYCKVLIELSAKEISAREGADSRDAQAFARLAAAFAAHAKRLPAAEKPKPVSADELMAELEKEPSKEEKMARCIRLGDSLALALPPE